MGFAVSRYLCNMTTATLTKTVITPVHPVTPEAQPSISFDTRLELAHVALNVLLDVPDDTQAAVQAALKEADGLAVACVLKQRETSTQRPGLFQSNPILKAAGDVIRARGWVRGLYDSSTGVCAMGAIRTVTRGDAWGANPEPAGEREAINVLLERIAAAFGPGLSVPGWNDRQEDAEGVLQLLW